jgi:hypothetical protein
MRKSLLTLSLALMLGAAGAAVAVAATAQAQAPTAQTPLLLAQASPQPFNRPLPPQGRGPAARRAPLSADEIAERRQAMCDDAADRMAGRLAYLEAKLDLTAAQRGAFARWRDARLSNAQRQARDCASRPVPARGADATPPSPVEQMARQEDRLRQRLAALQAERPALEALYNSLTPEQREKFRPEGGLRGMAGLGMGRGAGMRPRIAMMMRDRLIQRGPIMRGPGGRGPGGRGPGMLPPPGGPGAPPPAQ